MSGVSMFAEVSRLRARLGKSDWIVCAEAIKFLDNTPSICGVTCSCGPNGEPLACGYRPFHQGAHSWSTLSTVGEGGTS